MTTTNASDQPPNLPPPVEPFFQYTSLTRGFTVPTAVDIEVLASRIVEDEFNIDQILDPEIQRLSSLLFALQERRSHAANAIQKNRVYILPSPIRKLPPELLLTIFHYTCDMSRIRDTFDEQTFLSPLRISLVCARWRELCLVTPRLWACIYVARKDVYLPQSERPLVPLYVERSRAAPLCIKLGHCVLTPHIHPAKDALTLLIDNCRRWKSMFCLWRLGGGYEFNPYDFFRILVLRGTPMLKRLVAAECDSLPLQEMLTSSLNLREVYLHDHDEEISLPLERLKIFGGTGCYWDIFRSRRGGSSQIHFIMDDRPLRAFVRYTPSVSLTCLTLDPSVWRPCHWTNSFSRYLSDISFPQLRDLTLVVREHLYSPKIGDPVLVVQLANLITRSKCTLTAFRLVMKIGTRTIHARHIIDSSDDLNALLVTTPQLRTLHVIESAPIILDRRFFKRLNKPTFLPCLREVKFVWMPQWCAQAVIEPVVQTLLKKFLVTRTLHVGEPSGSKSAGAFLSSVVLGLRLGAEAPPGIVQCLQKLREEGVDAWLW